MGGIGESEWDAEKEEFEPDENSALEGYGINDVLYIRAECETTLDRFCFTNPVWIE